MKCSVTATAVGLILVFLVACQSPAAAADALNGQVSSAVEGAMEGVLVSAQKDGSTIRISVVTNEQGRYSFPSDKLEPGHYKLTIRAVGYDLPAASGVDVVASQPAMADLKLERTQNLEAQLTNADWLASMPESSQRRMVSGCTNCHTVQRIVDSTHTSDEFMTLVPRMDRYGSMSIPNHPQIPADRIRTAEPKGDVLRKFADYLASINLSRGPTRAYSLKTQPRPSGRATHVVVTEYQLPNPDLTEPHDVVVDADGIVWYSSFGEQILGRLDPKTGKVTEIPLPILKPDSPTGSLNLELDPDGNPWLAMMYQGGIAKFDKRTGKVQAYPLPPDLDNLRVQIGMVEPRHDDVDGKVWLTDSGTRGFIRLDLASGKMEAIDPFKALPKGQPHSAYGVVADPQNNLWFFDFADRNVGETDARIGQTVIYPVPTPDSRPRRGHMDANGRLAFAEFATDKVGIFDPKSEVFQEWPTPADFAPYDAVLDRNGELWAGGMNSDRVLRVDPKTGQVIAYLLPRETNIRRVFVDNTTTPVTFWVGSNHGGSIVKLEPTD